MAVKRLEYIFEYQGLSSDSKPVDATVLNGSLFHETDTGNTYKYDSSSTSWYFYSYRGINKKSRYSINHVDDDDDDTTVNYFGFEDEAGAWYIMKEDKTSNPSVYTYAKGASGYSTAWTNRASQSYDTFGNTF